MHGLCLCLPGNQSFYTEEEAGVAKVCEVVYEDIFPFMVSFAVLTNFLNAVVLIRLQTQSSPTPSRLYLFWLAVCHCLTCVPILIGTVLRNRSCMTYGWAVYVANIELPLYNSLNCCCVYIIVALSLDRYLAVCNSHNYSPLREFSNLPKRVALAFTIPILIYIPMCFVNKPVESDCYSPGIITYHIGEGPLYNKTIWKIWAVLVQIVHRLFPAFALTFINVRLLSTISKLRTQRSSMARKGSLNRSQRDRQLIQVLLALTVIFLLTNVPSGVLYILYVLSDNFCESSVPHEIFRGIANCLEMSSYCCDFFLYFLMNWEYRRGLKLLYRTCCKCSSPTSSKFNSPSRSLEPN